MKTLKHYVLTAAVLILGTANSHAQVTKRVLFLGNSYTGVNNLPQLVSAVAKSTGKTLVYNSNTPGGYYLGNHVLDTTSLQVLNSSKWDNVVLQDQSMALAYPSTFMNSIPYSVKLDSLVKANDECTQILFYATWGRKNGDQYWCTQPECPKDTLIVRTYYEMDSTIERHYKFFADSIKAAVTPVGAVWRYIRQSHPAIELFQPDESHPSLAGSYAAACCFYTTIFRSDPTLITYNAALSLTDANNIKQAVKAVVYDSLLKWNVGAYDTLLSSNCNSLSVDNKDRAAMYYNVFPNPVADILNIQVPANITRQKVGVYNILGLLIKELELPQNGRVSFGELPAGNYIIKVENSPYVFKVYKL
jgi:hypothetical protein